MKKTMTSKQAAAEVIKDAGEPLHIKAITERVLAGYETGLKGKTPGQTLAAMLHVAAMKGETFQKTAPGTFGLLDANAPAPAASAVEEDGESSPAVTPNSTVLRRGGQQAKPDPKRPSARKTSATRGKRTDVRA